MKAWSEGGPRPNFPCVWSYTLVPEGSFTEIKEFVTQNEATLHSYFSRDPDDGLCWGGCFRDGPEAAAQPILSRSAGAKLSTTLWRNDHVLVSSLNVFAGLQDLDGTLIRWRARKITLHVIDLGLVFHPEKADPGFVLVRAIVDLEAHSYINVKRKPTKVAK